MTTQSLKTTVDTAPDEIDVRKLFGILLDSKWTIVSITVLFLLLGIAYTFFATPIYKADALIQIEQKNNGGISSLLGEQMGNLFSSESSANTEIEIIKSRMILGNTIDKFHLDIVTSPDYFPFIGKGLARLTNQTDAILVSRFELPQMAQALKYKILITNSAQKTYQLLQDDKVLLSGKAGELVQKDGYTIFISDIKSNDGTSFTIYKRDELDTVKWLKSNLTISEKGKKTGIVGLSLIGENRKQIQEVLNNIAQSYFLQNVKRNSAEAEKSLEFLNGHLPAVKTKLNHAEEALNLYRQKNDTVDLGLEAKSTLESMVTIESQLNQLTFKESEISQRFTKDHPAYVSLIDKRKTLLKEKARLTQLVQKMPKTQREILRMRRDVEVNQQIYVQLLNKVQELSIMKASTVGNVRVLDDAKVYSNPIQPKKVLVIILSVFLGAISSVALALIRAALHKGVNNPDEIEALGLSVYASVPKSELQTDLIKKLQQKTSRRRENSSLHLLAETNPADLSIEALRGLRTSLHFAMMEAKNNIVMFTGPSPGIGKSFISTNFAAVVAKTGKRVLLIDGDMRKGYIQQPYGLSWKNGLSDYLSGKLDIQSIVKETQIDNVTVITRGQVPPNPSELLLHSRLNELLDWASEHYDLVIIDTPPILAVTDPCILGDLAGTTLMVTRFSHNTVKEIDVARSRFEKTGVEVKGVIFNAIEKKASSQYSNYGYYNYSYSDDSK